MNNIPYNVFSTVLDKNRQRKMCFYGRVSTEHEAQLSALQNQMQWYDDQLKYHSNWILVDRYIDEGITGTQAKKRPAFLRMIEDAKAGKFDLIVTREVCRFARNTVDTLIYTRELKNKYGIEVFFVEDNIWTMDGDGELRLTIMATLAQEESRKTSERVKAGQKISIDNGVLYGNGNILGYDRVGKTYVINEEQAQTVHMIDEMYLSGMGERKIMNELIRLKRKDSNGNVKWSVSKIDRILKRTTYMGVLTYGQSFSNNYLEQKRVNNKNPDFYQYAEFDYPRIREPEVHYQIQKLMQERTKVIQNGEKCNGKKKSEDVWLRKLKCNCGSSFRKNKWRTNKTTGEVVFGYQCYNQVNYGSKTFREKQGLDTEGYCDIKMIADWKLDLMAKEIISDIWKDRSESVILAMQMIIDCYENEPTSAQKAIKEIELKKQKVQNRISNLIEMRTDGEISKDEYFIMRKKLDDQLTQLNEELDSYKDEVDTVETLKDKLKIIEQVLNETIDFTQPKLPEYIIERFVQRVTPLDNNMFKWYISIDGLNGDGGNPNDNNEGEVIIGVTGRRGTAKIIDERGEISLPTYQNSTGSYYTKIGELLVYNIVIPFENARAYRKSSGRYLRCNQWDDISLEVHIQLW